MDLSGVVCKMILESSLICKDIFSCNYIAILLWLLMYCCFRVSKLEQLTNMEIAFRRPNMNRKVVHDKGFCILSTNMWVPLIKLGQMRVMGHIGITDWSIVIVFSVWKVVSTYGKPIWYMVRLDSGFHEFYKKEQRLIS